MLLHVLSFTKRDSEAFRTKAAQVCADLYLEAFGPALPVTPQLIFQARIQHLIWIEDDERQPVAATMVAMRSKQDYRIMGVAVASKRMGHGTALMRKIEEILPQGARLELGVDTGKDSTEWLQRWYERLGYETERDAGYEIVMVKRNKK